MKDYPTTGIAGADKGFLFIQSRNNVNKTAVYGIGAITTAIGSETNEYYKFQWVNTESVTAAFDTGEQVGIFYVPNGAKGSKGDPGDTLTTIDGGILTEAVP